MNRQRLRTMGNAAGEEAAFCAALASNYPPGSQLHRWVAEAGATAARVAAACAQLLDTGGLVTRGHAIGPSEAEVRAIHEQRAGNLDVLAAALPDGSPERLELERAALAARDRARAHGPRSVQARDAATRRTKIARAHNDRA